MVILKELGYQDNVKLLWKPSGTSIDVRLKELVVGSDSLKLAKHALGNNCKVEIYVDTKNVEAKGPGMHNSNFSQTLISSLI